MDESQLPARPGKRALYIGRAVSAVPVLMLVMSAVFKFLGTEPVREGMEKLGWPVSKAMLLGILEITCTILYVIPRTSVLGAILLTGYLGGAIATHVRIDDLWIGPAAAGVVIWIGLWLREPRLRALAPLRSRVPA